MVRYGKTLLSHQPAETTDLLIDLCSGTLSPKPSYLNGASSSSSTPNSNSTSPPVPAATSNNPAYLNVFNSGLNYTRTAVEAAAAATVAIGGAFPPLPGPSTARPPKPTLEGVEPKSSASDQTRLPKDSFVVVEGDGSTSPTGRSYIPPSPRQYFAHFINHPDHFLRFLEAVALARWNQKVDLSSSSSSTRRVAPPPAYNSPFPSSDPKNGDGDDSEDKIDQRAVWNTLLELYLLFSTTRAGPSSKETNKLKALKLLEQGDKIPYDSTHALILCSTNGFTEGLGELWEKLGMYEDVVRFWMEKEKRDDEEEGTESTSTSTRRHASDEVLARLRLYGPTQPQLYPLVLRFLTSSNALLARHGEDLKEVLETIDEERIMPTLEVVQVLSRNGVASVGVVKDWLREKVRGMRVEVDSVSSSRVASCFYLLESRPPFCLVPRFARELTFPRCASLVSIAGQNSHHLLPIRNPIETTRNRSSHGHLETSGLPSHSLYAVQPDARSAERSLYVQAFFPSTVRLELFPSFSSLRLSSR